MAPNPFYSLLRSRKFLLAVYGIVQTIVLHYLSIPSDIIAAADALVIAVIAGIAYEDNGERRLQSDLAWHAEAAKDDEPDGEG